MLWMTLLLFLALVAAGVVALYVAFPHRGEPMPVVPAVGDAMKLAVDAVPTVEDGEIVPRADRLAGRG